MPVSEAGMISKAKKEIPQMQMAQTYFDAKFSLSTGDALLKPLLLKMLPFTLSRLTICLQPSLEAFDSQLLQLINADCQNTVKPFRRDTLGLYPPFACHIGDNCNKSHTRRSLDFVLFYFLCTRD